MRAGTDASRPPSAADPAWTAPSHPPCGKLPAATRPTTDSSLLAQKGVLKKKKARAMATARAAADVEAESILGHSHIIVAGRSYRSSRSGMYRQGCCRLDFFIG